MISGPRPTYTPGPSKTDARNIAQEVVPGINDRLDALELACAGLWDLLKFKHGYTDEELVNAIWAVDSRDGKVDGKMTRTPEACPKCNRTPLVRNPKKCTWCGEELTRNPL